MFKSRHIQELSAIIALVFATFFQSITACAADILFLKGNLEISFGQPADLDKTLVAKLEEAGHRVHIARDFQPLTDEYLRQFHAVVWVGISPAFAEGRLYSPAGWQGGLHLLTVRENAGALRRYVEAGGGLLLNPSVDEMGMQIIPSHQRILDDYGIDIIPGQIRDPEQQFIFFEVLRRFPYHMAWTEEIARHPATKGVKRIYYPAYTMRWDDNYTTIPLYPRDKAWIPLVTAASSARVSNFRGTPFEQGHWKDVAEAGPNPAILAVRPFGKGRVGVTGIGHYHLFYFPYSATSNYREITFGPQDGILMTKGDGQTPADLETLLFQLYGWLSEPAIKAGFGFNPEAPVELADIQPVPQENVAAVWAQDDPLVTGEIRPMRILVGARTALSDGKGSVADYAAAAKAAGYDVVAFTETYEHIASDAAFRAFVEECRALSDEEINLLPGIDIEDALGNRYLIIGKESPVREHLRVNDENEEPGKQLIWTGHMLIGMGETLPIPSRPQRLATVREKGALPPELYSHFAGVAVATYRDGKQVDDGLFAYQWHLFNASIPMPVAVHEVYSPEEVAAAAQTGLQTLVNSDTPARAAGYFRQGHLSFGGNPMRTYLSSGPTAEIYDINDWSAEPWCMHLDLRSKSPITEVRVYDQRHLYRRFLPNANEARLEWYGDLGAQQWFYAEAYDADGGRIIMSPVRTLPGQRAFVRCMDRQNWFSGLHFTLGVVYTGRMRSLPKPGITISVPGVSLPEALAPKMHLTYNGEGHTIVDYVIDGTLVPGARDPGADASPIFNHLPIKEFEGRARYWFYMATRHRSGHPFFTVIENSVELKQALTPVGDVWPVLHTVRPANYRYFAGGEWVEGTVAEGETRTLPAGTLVGNNTVILDAAALDGKGRLGPVAGEKPVPAGTRASLRFLTINAGHADRILAIMGFAGDTPYKVSMQQGEYAGPAFALHFRPVNGGAAGTLTAIAQDELTSFPGGDQRIAAELHDGNPRQPFGVWIAENDAVLHYQYVDGIGRARLPVNLDTEFYIGSLIHADNADLALHFVKPWTAEEAIIEINNPTDKEITATVSTAAAVKTRRQIKQQITVPAGGSIVIGND